MVDTAHTADGVIADDGVPLKVKLARATRRQKIRALLLVTPLALFILLSFVWPITVMLLRSFDSPDFGRVMHRTSAFLDKWDGKGVPPEGPAWKALVEDLVQAREDQTIGKAATVVNFEMPAARSLFTKSARHAKKITAPPYKDQLDRRR